MKIAALIFGFLILLLSIQPIFIKWDNANASDNISKTTCCKNLGKKCPVNKPGKSQSENPCNTCNPFMPCNVCPYIPEQSQQLNFTLIVVDAENTNGLNNFILSSYHPDCWHPPEA